MSERSRDLYGDVQKLVGWLVAGREDSTNQMTGREYKYAMDRCSALRTALTQDLETRSSRPMWNMRRRRARRRWYVGEKKAARKCITIAQTESAQRAAESERAKERQAFERPPDRIR
jgi:hypothetical protein